MQTALILIDVQIELFQIPNTPIHAADTMLKNLVSLLEQAREREILTVHVQHCAEQFLVNGSPGWMIHPMVKPMPGELIVEKKTPDAFYGTSLHQELTSRGIERLIIGGLQTEYCIDTTCRRAFSLGYETILVKEGHSTMDSPILEASQIINHHNQVLGEWFVKLRPVEEVWMD